MSIRFARLAALLVTTAIVIGAAEIEADLAANSELRRIVAAHPGLSVAAVRAELFGGRLVLYGVEAGRSPGEHVTIERLTLARAPVGFGLVTSARAESVLDAATKALGTKPETPSAGGEGSAGAGVSSSSDAANKALAPAATGSAIPGTATAENVVITHGLDTYHVRRIDLTGTSLSNADLAHLLDPNSGEPIEARLRKLSATAINVPEIIEDDATPGSEDRTTYTDISLAGTVAGKATAANVGGMAFESKAGNNKLKGTFGPIRFVGLDLAQLVHVVETTRSSDAEPVLPLYDSFAMRTVTFSDDKGEVFHLATLTGKDARARPLKPETIAELKSKKKDASNTEMVSAFADLAHSLQTGAIEMTDLAAAGHDPKDPKFKLANFSWQGFSQTKVGGWSLAGFRVETPDVKLGLDKMDVGSFGLPKIDATNATNAAMPSAGKADLTGLSFDVAPKKAGETPVKFTVGHIGYVGDGDPGDIPRSVKMVVDNILLDVPSTPGNAHPLIEMGYSHLDLSAAFASTYDPQGQALQIRDLSLKGVDMGSLGIGLQLVNVTKGLISQNKEVVKASMLAILVKGLSFEVVNQGLVDRALAWKAKQDNMSVENEKASLINYFDKTLPETFNSANVKVVGSAVAKFVANPKTLHIEIRSKGGLGVGSAAMLSDPALLIDSLDVKATAD